MVTQQERDEIFMRRCLELAAQGRQNAKPNPMVGAVIVSERGDIIGEGYHVRCGEGHAEVNAFASVCPGDERLLPSATLYVSLEPCAHYGKTPPCADLIVSKGVRRVVCGCVDPFAKVRGRGIERIRQAGIEVTVGVLRRECEELNKRFFTFQRHHRPYIILKWAQTADGFLDDHFRPLVMSTPFTRMLSHRLRAENDAILVGHVTDLREHPSLTTRYWPGPDPKRLVLEGGMDIHRLLDQLYRQQVQSLVVEGGAKTHQSFIAAGLYDEIRVEVAPLLVGGGTPAPHLPVGLRLESQYDYDGNIITTYRENEDQSFYGPSGE